MCVCRPVYDRAQDVRIVKTIATTKYSAANAALAGRLGRYLKGLHLRCQGLARSLALAGPCRGGRYIRVIRWVELGRQLARTR